jgi:hypothetical protein
MQTRRSLVAIVLWLAAVAPAVAQFKEGGKEAEGTKLGKSEVTRWRLGLVITAAGGACRGGTGCMSVPMDWPEQDVSIVEEDVSPEIKIHYAQLSTGAKAMNIKIGRLASGQEAKALVTFEIRRSEILPPKDTDAYVLADPEKVPRDVQPFLGPSIKIESRDPKFVALAKEIGADKKNAWDRVEAIYDWVREHIKDKDISGTVVGALGALKDGEGNCESRTSVFVAICRAAKIPARTVWVQGHVYPEFYLVDGKGEGHWFPCQSRGARQFGGITDLRPIWQKGDNVRSSVKKERKRYLDFDLSISGDSRPQVRPVREPVAK